VAGGALMVGCIWLEAYELRAGLLTSLNSAGPKFTLQEYKQSNIKNSQNAPACPNASKWVFATS
jgi:hypothetical protein